ncbi:MAG TPA: bifunctional 5,10-methylenetetrahydrofolate dehydrogenase/5,10-methenyltetrahydrofolate cyclohydrolase [Candidatus Paceibacterota bacterium]|jgi:5,10-methylene-tetrahydrofolate dehydrogenase/Methenyl tetrahydrofolate cyclohydrolase
MQIIDGRKARDFYKAKLIERVAKLSRVPCLAIVQIGDDPSSVVYIEQKKKFGALVGAAVEHIHMPATTSFETLGAKISELNARLDVDGIIIQLPLPAHLDKILALNLIDPKKDVDGLCDENQRLLAEGHPHFVPATAKGVLSLLDYYGIDPKDKKVAVMGRSRLVGSPLAELFRLRGATVSVCHSKTPNTPEIAKTADILVVAIGKPHLVDAQYLKQGVVVIDVGLSRTEAGLCGDVDPEAARKLSSAYTPVPGGVGPMTVLSLFDNLISSAQERVAAR